MYAAELLARLIKAEAAAIDAHLSRQVSVSDEDVKRAVVAYNKYIHTIHSTDACATFECYDDGMRAALEADRAGRGGDVPDGMIERLRIAARALVRDRTVFAEDVETLADVVKLLESLVRSNAATVKESLMVGRIDASPQPGAEGGV